MKQMGPGAEAVNERKTARHPGYEGFEEAQCHCGTHHLLPCLCLGPGGSPLPISSLLTLEMIIYKSEVHLLLALC